MGSKAIESRAYELADPLYRGEITPEHLGGCYVTEVRKRQKKFRPHVAWGQALEELGIYENKEEVETDQ
ncbi:MAG: hypothetical protein Q8N21_01520 [bacterium]|nr:hypothetical protein [bacterium]